MIRGPAVARQEPSLEHLLALLDLLALRVRAAVERRRETDPNPDDRFRGLYLAEANVEALLDAPRPVLWQPAGEELAGAIERRAAAAEADGATVRLRRLAHAFELQPLDIDFLLVALAPDLDPRFERLYGYLHDDVTRRRASVGLAMELCGVPLASAEARARLGPSSPLVAGGLLSVEDRERPLLSRSLRVPDRVSAHLLGDDSPEPELAALLSLEAQPAVGRWAALEQALAAGVSPVYLREVAGASGAALALSAARELGLECLVVDLGRLAAGSEPAMAAAATVREARLREALLVAGPMDALIERAVPVAAALAEAHCAVVLAGARAWDPAWSRAVPLSLEVPQASVDERSRQWGIALDGNGGDPALLRSTLAFRLTPLQIARAAQSARLHARVQGRDLGPADVQAGARAQNTAGLDRLARHVEPRAGWPDLVLPPEVHSQLRELAARARQRERVLDEWRAGGRAVRGRGITALFAGDSGTGKTMSAEVVAGDLGLDLYVIDLSTVVDKYIGETEKNLDRIFVEADRVNGVLLFDEADAIFGKRSEVRDARDRYANVEIAYLLQRMERFDGLAILTTNLRANLDEAFTRRIDVIVDFPLPEDDDRLALWRMHLPAELPQADDLDLEFMARRFRLSGGNIRNACLTAAFLAAEQDRPVTMADLIRGTEREYRKLGRLTVEAEFGPYLDIARPGT
ncbi:MAG TPA: ATP-binding protein [Candidatus Limnocylindria bacterium]|nr:ATP-binding protein [Candidatus Limnocylindria bacterium]